MSQIPLPEAYNRTVIEEELRKINQSLETLKLQQQWIPLANPPAILKDGLIAFSDGSIDWGPGAAQGLYRYQLSTTAWVRIG